MYFASDVVGSILTSIEDHNGCFNTLIWLQLILALNSSVECFPSSSIQGGDGAADG